VVEINSKIAIGGDQLEEAPTLRVGIIFIGLEHGHRPHTGTIGLMTPVVSVER